MSVRVSRAALNRIRNQVRGDRVRFIELRPGEWHAVRPSSVQAGTYLVVCSGERRLPRRTATDLPSHDVCPRCIQESETNHAR